MHQGTGLPRLILMSRRAVGSKVNLIHASIFFKIAKDVCVGYWGLMLMIPSLGICRERLALPLKTSQKIRRPCW